MAKFILPKFGQLDTENLEEYYDATIDLNGQEVQIDLNFGETTIGVDKLESVKKFIETISDLDLKNRKYIEADYHDEDADSVRTYVEHHLEELDEDDLSSLIDKSNKKLNPEMQLVKQLRLVRMGLYPQEEDQFAIFDYSIDPELTQYLVVLFTNEHGEVEYITMES